MTKKQIIKKLDNLGIVYDDSLSKEELEILLNEEEGVNNEKNEDTISEIIEQKIEKQSEVKYPAILSYKGISVVADYYVLDIAKHKKFKTGREAAEYRYDLTGE